MTSTATTATTARRSLRSLGLRSLGRRAAATGAAAALLAGGLGLGLVAPASAAPANDPAACNYKGYQSGPDLLGLKFEPEEQKMFDAINAYRVAHGLKKLKVSTSLARPAVWMAVDSVSRDLDEPTHTDSRGMGPADRVALCTDNAGYSGYAGEIVLLDDGATRATAQARALEAWKQSPPHNAQLLSPNVRYAHVAWAYNGVNSEISNYWVVDFGR